MAQYATSFRVIRDSEYDQYVVRFYDQDGKVMPEACWYYTGTRQDAVAAAEAEIVRAKRQRIEEEQTIPWRAVLVNTLTSQTSKLEMVPRGDAWVVERSWQDGRRETSVAMSRQDASAHFHARCFDAKRAGLSVLCGFQ